MELRRRELQDAVHTKCDEAEKLKLEITQLKVERLELEKIQLPATVPRQHLSE